MKKKKIIKNQNKIIENLSAQINSLTEEKWNLISRNNVLAQKLDELSKEYEECSSSCLDASDIAELLKILFGSKDEGCSCSCGCSSQYTPDDVVKLAYDKTHTVIYWSDGTRTICECDKQDMDNGLYDAKVGFLISLAKKAYGSNMVNVLLKKYFPTPKTSETAKPTEPQPSENDSSLEIAVANENSSETGLENVLSDIGSE